MGLRSNNKGPAARSYGPQQFRFFARIAPTGSAGVIPTAEVNGNGEATNIKQVSRLSDGSYEFLYVDTFASGCYVSPRLVGVTAPASTGSYVASTHATGSRVQVLTSAGVANHSWTQLDVEFWTVGQR